jgi:catechol 2,3-dioxygenase-like lactoylglutathione lyase family enzyme
VCRFGVKHPNAVLKEVNRVITRIAHTALIVREYDEAIEFYCGKLGFRVAEDTPLKNKRWVRLKAPGGEGSEILLSKAVSEKQKDAVGNQTGGRVLFFFHTDDFDGDYAKLSSMGVEFVEGPWDEEYGKAAVLKDLYGNRIDLIQPK